MSYTYDYPRPGLTADVLVFHKKDDSIKNPPSILLIKRNEEPYKDCWALPGGYVEQGETVMQAAIRELKEETGIVAKEKELVPGRIYDDPTRDPRGWTISGSFYALIVGNNPYPYPVTLSDESSEYKWATLKELKEMSLAFDHKQMIEESLVTVYDMMLEDRMSIAIKALS